MRIFRTALVATLCYAGMANALLRAAQGNAAAPSCGRVGTLLGFVVLNSHTVVGGTDAGSLVRSVDGGRCWSAASLEVEVVHRFGTFLRDPANTSILLAGAGTPGRVGFYATSGMLRSTDGGKSWHEPASQSGLPSVRYTVNDLSANAHGLFLSLSCPDEQAAIQSGQTGAFHCGQPVYRSRDGGATWQAVGPGSGHPASGQTAPAFDGSVLSLAASNTAIYATASPLYGGTGLYRASPVGTGWQRISPDQRLQGATTLATVATPVRSLLAGTGILQGHAEVLRSTDGGHTWRTALSSAVLQDPAVLQLLATPDGMFCLGLHHLFRSSDGGATWQAEGVPGPPGQVDSYLGRFPDGELLLARAGGLFRSVDAGVRWRQM